MSRQQVSKQRSRCALRKGKRGWSSMIPALALETLAIVGILIAFFGMRADLRKQQSQQALFQSQQSVQGVIQGQLFNATNVSPFSEYRRW